MVLFFLENGAPYLSLGVGGSNHLLAAGTELTHAQATVEIWCVFFLFFSFKFFFFFFGPLLAFH